MKKWRLLKKWLVNPKEVDLSDHNDGNCSNFMKVLYHRISFYIVFLSFD